MPDLQHTEPTEALTLVEVMWVPHYREVGIYVAPGGVTCSREALLRHGAKPRIEHLWPRPKVR